MSEQAPGAPTRLRTHVAARLRIYLFTGILVTAPVALTLYVAWAMVAFVDSLVAAILPEAYNPNNFLPFALPGVGLVLVLIALTLIGALTAGLLGRVIVNASERFFARMPIVRTVYSALKQIFETVLTPQSKAFRGVVLIEWPRKECWTVGFVTGATGAEIRENTAEDILNIYLPTTPNPTSGYLVFMRRADCIFLRMSVEDAMKLIVSGGIISPEGKPARARTDLVT